jgi:hypothetical protein
MADCAESPKSASAGIGTDITVPKRAPETKSDEHRAGPIPLPQGAGEEARQRCLSLLKNLDDNLAVTSRSMPLCQLTRLGARKRNKLQVVFGLMCTAEGCPVAVEVFEGNVGDPSTLASQISKLKQRFDLDRVVLIGDRGLITEARIEETVSRPVPTSSPPRVRRRSAALPRPAAFSFRSSTSAIWPRSARPTIPASVSSPAAICCSPTNVRASDASCSMPPSRICSTAKPASSAPRGRYVARTRSRSRSVQWSTITRWPSTSPSPSPTII